MTFADLPTGAAVFVDANVLVCHLVVAMMQANGLTHLASHDSDFDRVPGITRYAPI
jgi:predicted nucleic acid-binding protein